MARINAKQPLWANSPAAWQLDRVSKAALIDVVIDCCRRMYGEDVFEQSPAACLNDACRGALRARNDYNPWMNAAGTELIGSQFDERPYKRPQQ